MLVQVYEIATPNEARAVAALGVDHVGILVVRVPVERDHRFRLKMITQSGGA